MSERVIGIDLGTTNSCASYMDEGQVKMVPGRNGEFIIPSILSLDAKGNLSIGQQAKRRFVTNPQNTVYGAKRLMGRKLDSDEMADIQQSFFYDIEADHDSGEARITVEGRAFSLVEVSAIILEEIKETCQEFFEQRISKAVISVPAYFDNTQREAVRTAGAQAGLDVLRIINEPTAAALAYGFGKRENQRILVFDLGGGTFDVTVLQLFEEVYEVIATGGDSFLGGIDFDNAIVQYLLDQFKAEHSLDLSEDKVALQRIRDAAEHVKIDLSSTDIAQVNLPFIAMRDGEPVTLNTEVSREQFQKLVEPLAMKALRITEKVLLEGKVGKEDIDDIILVGGMTRAPIVQDFVERYFGRKPRRDVHPDEVVAQGAAILADSIAAGGAAVVLKDVLPVSIGVGIKGQFRKLINKNTTLPTRVIKPFKTSSDNQASVKLELYQGESRDCANNSYLGELTLAGFPPGPKGSVEIRVAFIVDDNGILNVKAKDMGTGNIIEAIFETDKVIQRESYRADKVLSEEEARRAKTDAVGNSPTDAAGATQAKSSGQSGQDEPLPQKTGGFLGWLKRLFGS